MELILKPTGRCNFKCKFCAASELMTNEDRTHVHPNIKRYIEDVKPHLIIITGGDPLMMDPSYYYELHDIVGDLVKLYATTNLKDFYLNPHKWTSLLNEDWFNVTTSFQYGSGRMWDINTVYNETMFLKVMDQYSKYVNKNLPIFISVISEENEMYAIDNVRLAKRLNTVAKLNAALPVGKQGTWYPRYKMYQLYIDIIDKHGLGKFESNCIDRSQPKCPKNIYNSCNDNIRCCYVGSDGTLHVGICDEMLELGYELTGDDIYCKSTNNTIDPTTLIHDKCVYCQLCRLCNGCNLNREFAKSDPNYCTEMKKLEESIIDHGWSL